MLVSKIAKILFLLLKRLWLFQVGLASWNFCIACQLWVNKTIDWTSHVLLDFFGPYADLTLHELAERTSTQLFWLFLPFSALYSLVLYWNSISCEGELFRLGFESGQWAYHRGWAARQIRCGKCSRGSSVWTQDLWVNQLFEWYSRIIVWLLMAEKLALLFFESCWGRYEFSSFYHFCIERSFKRLLNHLLIRL